MSDVSVREPTRDDFRGRNPYGELTDATRPVGAIANAEQQKSIAEVQARMIIARANPRDPIRCMDMILRDCTRPSLADAGLYQYSRGGSSISGPSIRLAEAIAQRWGNIASGLKEISRAGGYSECIAYAWDLESGYYDERQFQVRHWRDTKAGGYQLTDERDIYELIANMGARRKRAALLTVIPGDVVEAATEQCEVTLKTTADTSPEALARIAVAFEQYGVTKAQIEKRCQCRLEAIRPAQVVQLRKIFASLKDGMSDAKDWFDMADGVWAAVDAQHAANAKPAETTRRAPRKAAAKEAAPVEEDRIPEDRWDAERQEAAQADAPETQAVERQPDPTPPTPSQTAAPAKFEAWLVDGEGTEIADQDGVIQAFTDPILFVQAYLDAEASEFPGTIDLFRKANAESIELARAFPLAAAILDAPRSAPAEVADAPAADLFGEAATVDPDFIAPPTKLTKPEFESFNDRLKVILARAATPDAINHVIDINGPVYETFPPKYKLAAKVLVETRQKEISPAPARNAAPPTYGEIAAELQHDIAGLTSPAEIDGWLAMASVERKLTMLRENAPNLYDHTMTVANERRAATAPKQERTARSVADEMIAKMRACSTEEEATSLSFNVDNVHNAKFVASEDPAIWIEVTDVAKSLLRDRPGIWGNVRAKYEAARQRAATPPA